VTSDVARAARPAVPTAPASPSAAAPRLAAVIPALDEASSIGLVLSDLAGTGAVERVVVCDNGSTDATADIASRAGAWVVRESRRGYGAACLRALAALEADPPDIVLFLDADRSDDPGDLSALLAPLREGTADLVIGSRARGRAESGSMTPAQRFGNWLASRLLRAFYGVPATDLGPFRAIRWDALRSLGMRDQDFGWTIEMQVKAARRGLRVREVPVRYRKRIGRSKISGTVRGTVLAGAKILGVVAADLARHGPPRRLDPASRRGIGL
jgi:glycosyltransferase involved in cell wall biosynthesis